MTDDTTFDALHDRLRLQLFDATELGILELSTAEGQLPKVQFVAAELYVGVRIADGPYVSAEQADAWDVSFSEVIMAALAAAPPLEIGDAHGVGKTLRTFDNEPEALEYALQKARQGTRYRRALRAQSA